MSEALVRNITVFLVTAGIDDFYKDYYSRGRIQMKRVANFLKETFHLPVTTPLLTSTAYEAIHSARIIKDTIGLLELRADSILCPARESDIEISDYLRIMMAMQDNMDKFDVVFNFFIIVSHLSVIESALRSFEESFEYDVDTEGSLSGWINLLNPKEKRIRGIFRQRIPGSTIYLE